MKKITQENFTTHVIETYSTLQTNINKARESIYKFQNTFGFKEIPDITIRCTNANISAVKFFKKHDINYYDNSLSNNERVIMLAVESYIFNKCIKAKNALSDYINAINAISDKVSKKPAYKIYAKYGAKLKRYFNYEFNTKSHFLEAQKYLDEYERIVNEITNFDVETDMYKAVESYLPVLYSNLCNLPIGSKEADKLNLTNKLFHYQLTNLIVALTKCGLVSEITTIGPQAEKIMMDELEKRKPLIEKEELEEKEQLKLAKIKR